MTTIQRYFRCPQVVSTISAVKVVQWGLEFGMLENRIHSKTERFKIRFSNGLQLWNEPFENRTFKMAALAQVILYKNLFLQNGLGYLPFKIGTKWQPFCSVFEWLKTKWLHQPRQFYEYKYFLYKFKMVQVNYVRFSNGWDQNRTTMDHPNTELVRYSSPHCIC